MKYLSLVVLITLVASISQARNSYSCEERGLQIMRIFALNEGDRSPYENWWVEAIPTRWTLEGLPFQRLAIKSSLSREQMNQFEMVIRYYQYRTRDGGPANTDGFKVPDNASRHEIWDTKLSFNEFIGYGTHINSNLIVGNPVEVESTRPGVFSFTLKREGRYFCSTRMNVFVPEFHR